MFPWSFTVTLGLLVLVLYPMVGYCSFERMALSATEDERPFVEALSEGRAAARVVWLVYVLAWPLLHAAVLVGPLWRRPGGS